MSFSGENDGAQTDLSSRKLSECDLILCTQKLESYFMECQYPSEMECGRLAIEVGLTESQIKFWFINKRNIVKVQNGSGSNFNLRVENERLKRENFLIREWLKQANMNCSMCILREETRVAKQEVLKIENMLRRCHYGISCTLPSSSTNVHVTRKDNHIHNHQDVEKSDGI